MAYKLEIRQHVEKTFEKILKKDPAQGQAIKKKIKQIIEEPQRFKPLRKPMQGKRRVHAYGPFVLIYSIKENEKIVVIEDYDHHDRIYR
ncbi:MAG: type II toxin-antitoxin system RelE/ParE family toxin [Candidatus Diapherotrites archaeon]|uniref:Type II toxin-antitoxin system RelE/ParE family toxin n=1 Tax=Candidatus Iainarchaeum sp. TaxID=3101447 RepID=A0A938YX04_9ARCH|nr:type II toxin-antitoxin system RelE/ParE family toxin [Candidatus Diapherotrites archaeon]